MQSTARSSVTDMLQELKWESLESRRVKIQLTLLFKVVSDLVDIADSAFLIPASTQIRANHTKKLRQISSKSDAFKYNSHEPFQFGILCRPLWPRPLTWYPSSMGSPLLRFKLGKGQSASRARGFLKLCRLDDRIQWQLL